VSWEAFAGTGANDGLLQKWLGRLWIPYLVCTILCFTVTKKARFQIASLAVGGILLILLSYAKFVKAQYQLPMFIEHGGQMLMPVILIFAVSLGIRHRATVITAMIALIMTFVGHGTYALGLGWPTPANFYGMTSVILGVGQETAGLFLGIAGVLDLVVCVGIFIPKIRRASALYAVAWGLLTALARPVAGMSMDLNYWGADQFLHETVLRAPHFLIPLYLYLVWRPQQPFETSKPVRKKLTDKPAFNR